MNPPAEPSRDDPPLPGDISGRVSGYRPRIEPPRPPPPLGADVRGAPPPMLRGEGADILGADTDGLWLTLGAGIRALGRDGGLTLGAEGLTLGREGLRSITVGGADRTEELISGREGLRSIVMEGADRTGELVSVRDRLGAGGGALIVGGDDERSEPGIRVMFERLLEEFEERDSGRMSVGPVLRTPLSTTGCREPGGTTTGLRPE